MPTEQVCQPLAISPPKKPVSAAAASTWNGCGSKRRPKSTISCAVKLWRPISTLSPTLKSSHQIMLAAPCVRSAEHARAAHRAAARPSCSRDRSEEHTSELQSHLNLVCRLLLEKKK